MLIHSSYTGKNITILLLYVVFYRSIETGIGLTLTAVPCKTTMKTTNLPVHFLLSSLFYENFLKFFSLLFLRLPTPRPGEVLGLVGTNGIGKSTALKILAGKQKPNLGRFDVSFSLGSPEVFMLSLV